MSELDLAVVGDETTGDLMIHKALCPEARAAADRGLPVMTMFGCSDLPTGYPRHSCLDDIDDIPHET